MRSNIVKIFLSLIFLFQVGCTTLRTPVKVKPKIFSCEEEVKPKSLEYFEQKYRCTSGE